MAKIQSRGNPTQQYEIAELGQWVLYTSPQAQTSAHHTAATVSICLVLGPVSIRLK